MLDSEIKREIASMVRLGFDDHDRILQVFSEELYSPGELDQTELDSELKAQFREYEQEKLGYPDVTDCDRLDTAFSKMIDRGIIAIQNAGYTQSDGYDDVRDLYSQHKEKKSVLGYCFYHGQDLERAASSGELFLAFGPIDPAEEQTIGITVGNIIRKELENVELPVKWDGTFENRLSIAKLIWQKR